MIVNSPEPNTVGARSYHMMSEIKQTTIAGAAAAAENYYSKDFDWEEEVRKQVEIDPSLQFHCRPFQNPIPIPNSNSNHDSQAWDQFHTRHSTGKFFKVKLNSFPLLLLIVMMIFLCVLL